MDILHELFGTFSGWLVVAVVVVMVIGIPAGIALGLRRSGASPAEIKDRKAHPEYNPDRGR